MSFSKAALIKGKLQWYAKYVKLQRNPGVHTPKIHQQDGNEDNAMAALDHFRWSRWIIRIRAVWLG